jgi:photosystem II stability/assembly factor-like uncharacterized protein
MTQQSLREDLLQSVKFRCIGPPRGGRVVAVAGDPSDPGVAYFGAVAGGLWKTEDAGTTWAPISDGYFKTSSVGAIAVSALQPNIIFVGMGESTIRTDVSYGDGVYKSTDHGHTWTHMGLNDTRHIGRVRVHPRNPDIVYVAALGHAFGPNEERGVFRSKDGGHTWEKVLYVSDRAGAVDLSIDERNPDAVYATFWETYRNFWELSSGGPGSGLWRSTDGGDTWTDITRNKGLPEGLLGKLGVAASPVKNGRVWAIIEAKDKPGLYRSDDFGNTWMMLTDNPDLRQRPWYYMHIYADTQDADTVYVLNLDMWKSSDGGKTFNQIGTPHGDNHDLWIDPANNRRMVQGNDGGACVSFNAGESFSTIYNQNTAQFYHIAVDGAFPYRVYGTQQDNSSIAVPSDTNTGAIAWTDCFPTGTGESGYIAVHPDDPDIVYVGAVGSSPGGMGSLERCDMSSGHIQLINVWPQSTSGMSPSEFKYRFPWTYPILFSPHDSGTLYTCGNVAFRSTDEGHSWEAFSPDLTAADEATLVASGGPITLDTSGAEHYATISAFIESPHEAGVFWAGSDDGLVHISRDSGASWQNVTPPELPAQTFICTLEPAPDQSGKLYLSGIRHKLDDPAPYLFVTEDYGASWRKITDGIPLDDYTRVIRSDPEQPGLLYAGTELGLYVSFDDGRQWQRWQANFPVTPVFDLLVKDSDLVIATHGRSFWIADDLTPLRQLVTAEAEGSVRLFAPRTTVRILPDLTADWTTSEGRGYSIGITTAANFVAKRTETGQVERTFLDTGEGADRGAILYYSLPSDVTGDTDVHIEFVDAQGEVVRTLHRKPAGYGEWDDKRKSLDTGPWLPAKAGVNRFVWDLRYEGATRVAGNKTASEALAGPLVLPGRYSVRLYAGQQQASASFDVINDARVNADIADLEAQLSLLLRIRDKVSDAHAGVNRLREIRTQVEGWRKRMQDNQEISDAAGAVLDKLAEIEDELILPGEQKNVYSLIQRDRLNAALASVISVVASADAAPTVQSVALADEYAAAIDEQLAMLREVVGTDIDALNRLIEETGAPAIQ